MKYGRIFSLPETTPKWTNDLRLDPRHRTNHSASIRLFRVPVHISQLEFIFEANFCVYTEIVCLWKFLKRTFKIFLTVFSSYKHHRAKDIALSKHTEQILVLLPKEITQKLHDIVVT